jgi:hypothetical protein
VRVSKTMHDDNALGGSVSEPVHMFNDDLPLDGSRAPEAVGLCLAAVPPIAASTDWAKVTCKQCLWLEDCRARSRRRKRNGR